LTITSFDLPLRAIKKKEVIDLSIGQMAHSLAADLCQLKLIRAQ
jgi:hypothetical protein